jgi:hypothetical protein
MTPGEIPSIRKPSVAALLLALLPFLGLCFSVPLWDRIHPVFLGLPFNMLWLMSWIVLTSLCLWCAHWVECSRERGERGT